MKQTINYSTEYPMHPINTLAARYSRTKIIINIMIAWDYS